MTVKCIRCGRVEAVKKINDREYRCGSCEAIFDDDPDEGGTHGHRPDQRLLREERARQRRLGRRY